MVSVSFSHARRRSLCMMLPLMGLAGASCWSGEAKAACEDLLPRQDPGSRPSRLVTSEDLLRLRDTGSPDASLFEPGSALAISPDGRQVAFVLSRADPDRNAVCRALVLVNRSGPAQPRIIDQGGDLIAWQSELRGATFELGLPATITPVWSPYGQWIAYRRRDHGVIQAWRARSDGSGAQPLTRSEVDVEILAWSRDGHRLIYGSKPAKLAINRAIDKEGESGWHYDARISPQVGARPLMTSPLPREAFAVDPDNGRIEPASPEDTALVSATIQDLPSALATGGRRAWTEHSAANPLSPLKILVAAASGPPIKCTAEACRGKVTNLLWEDDGRSLLYLRREGWDYGQMGLYRWRPGQGAPRRILLTDDVLHGCIPSKGELICTAENATMPRRIVAIDLHSGARRLIFDPNPEFAAIRLGTVERLTWRNDIGLPAWGDLVLPPDYRPGTRLPMVIVQYHSDGFLRGGTGDEYPIYAFAARGFAVLSLEPPPTFGANLPELHSWVDVTSAGIKDGAERKSLFSSLMTGVNQVIARGLVDPARIGISGLSDGSTTARYALVNSRLFAAAAISTCCADTRSMMIAGGTGFADMMHAEGYPRSIADPADFWTPFSMTLAARRMDRPLLMQLADDELNLGLETFTALREAGQPVDMYVFPGEHHLKVQPVHRRAIYNRNLDWFSFWLQGKEDPDPAKTEQYRRWDAMRRILKEKAGAPPP